MERIPEIEVIGESVDVERYNQIMGRGMVMREYRHLARRAAGLLPAEQAVKALDVGTGPGFVAIEIARLLPPGSRVTGLDLSAAMLDSAGKNAAQAGLSEMMDWKEGDAARMPFPDNSFDLITSSGSLHHWENPPAVFDEMARVLRPGGALVVRDSRRLQPARRLQPNGSTLLARLIGWTLPADFRKHYWNSIRASYTLEEVGLLLAESKLKGACLEQDELDLMIVIDPQVHTWNK